MMPDSHIESLYQEAKSALKARDYEYAIELLKRVLVIDESYKDTSRLLEKVVRLRKLRWYKNPRLWGALGLVVVFVLGIVIAPKIGGLLASPAPTNALSPTGTNTSMPTSTPTVTPTRTPRPTATVTPIPSWVTNFAEPILLAIQDRPPDFQDDFLQVSPGWSFDSHTNNEHSKMEITDGVLLMTVGAGDIGGVHHSKMHFDNFVFQIEVNLTKTSSSGTTHISSGSNLGLSLARNGNWNIYFCKEDCENLASGRVSTYPYERVPITIISKGTEYAVLVNGIPLSHLSDSGRGSGADIGLRLHTNPGMFANVRIQYDNLKVWDLDKIPNLP